MPYFKDLTGSLWYLSEEDVLNGGEGLLPAGYVTVSDEEAVEIQNPPPTPEQILAAQSQKLRGFIQLASAQKAALTNRIDDLQFSIKDGTATPADETELPVRQGQSTAWYRYSAALGRLSNDAGWPETVTWPEQPKDGMDLSLVAVVL